MGSEIHTGSFFKKNFSFETEREQRRGAEGERERLLSRLHSVRSLMRGSTPRPWDRDRSQNQEVDAQPTVHPGAQGRPVGRGFSVDPARPGAGKLFQSTAVGNTLRVVGHGVPVSYSTLPWQ